MAPSRKERKPTKTSPVKVKPSKPPKVSLTSIKSKARSMWDDSHILVAGHTHELASDLATALARILKSHGLHLYIKEAQVSRRYVHANDRVIDYILATGPKPSPKKWDRLVALADILRPEAPFDTDHELWASAVTQEL